MNPETESMTDSVSEAYDSGQLNRLSEHWQQVLAQHFEFVFKGESRVLNWSDPTANVQLAESMLDAGNHQTSESRAERFHELITTALARGQNLHNPGYIGHQVPASIPVAGLFDAIGSLTNQPMAIYEMGPWATAVEHALVRALCRKIGWNSEESSGLLTSGGSLANLTALLTARNVAFPDCWKQGVPGNAVIIAHADAHYCVARSAGILGLGTERIIKAQLTDDRRMDSELLASTIAKAHENELVVMAVVACACATPVGAFDRIAAVADICAEHKVWLHVDAAHGGAALMSRRHKSLLDGIDRADSVVWDAHKMMFVPALCAAVLYRNREHRYLAFQQDAPYLFDPDDPGMADFDNGVRTVECTKRALGFGLWGAWSMFGESLFEDLVDHSFAMCRHLFQLVSDAADFEPLHQPDCNILVFRFLPGFVENASLDVQNQLQRQIRSTLVQAGDFYIVQTTIDGVVALRVCVMNPLTTKSNLEELLTAIRRIGSQVEDRP